MLTNRSQNNAIILSAGRSSQFFPPLYDKPKGMFVYKNEILIERQIQQLLEAGIKDIIVVVGYEKERFFYLEEKYGVKLLVSTGWEKESNVTSLVLAREFLGNSYICCADHWYESNPFVKFGRDGKSQRMVKHLNDARGEMVVDCTTAGLLSRIKTGEKSGICMVGAAFVTKDWADGFLRVYDEKKDYLGTRSMLWEQFWSEYCSDLNIDAYTAPEGTKEFDSLEEFGDSAIVDNINQSAISKICTLLNCCKADIKKIRPISAGLTNVSFTFEVFHEKYVYRHPGQSSNNLVNRKAECLAQTSAIKLGIDYSVLDIGHSGWKLSKYIEHIREYDSSNADDVDNAIKMIKRLHNCGVQCDFTVDMLAQGDRLMDLAYAKKGETIESLHNIREKLQKIWHFIELDGWKKVLCHNDIYAANWIISDEGYCLIDWEYAGMNDQFADLAAYVIRDELPDTTRDYILRTYCGSELSNEQIRHAYGIFALSAWYWLGWCLYKDTLGEDGFFMLSCWRALHKYVGLALPMYEKVN